MYLTLKDLAPEEQDYILQVGKISRPFAFSPTEQPFISRLITTLLPSSEWEVNGVDISVWQGLTIDFSALMEKAKFIIMRYGIGNTTIDAAASRNVSECIRLNIPYSGYWYLKPEKDWRKQAESFSKAIDTFGGNLYHMSDFEENGGLNKSSLDGWLQKYFNLLYTSLVNKGIWNRTEQHMWYTSKNIVDNFLPNPNGWMRYSSLDVANWTTAPTPLIPNEWEKAGKTYKFWQHAVVYANQYGVLSQKIDLQRYNGTTLEFNNEFSTNLPLPVPPAEPPPVIPPVEPPETPPTYVIPTGYLNVRTAPIVNASTQIGVADPKDKFEYIGEEGDWTMVKVYLYSKYLRKE